MAAHAHSTPTPLLRPADAPPPLLPAGLGRQPGPVTIALAAMRAADPDHHHVRELRRRIADRIEADIALLDELAGDADFEEGADAEPSLCGAGTHEGGALNGMNPSQGGDDREEENEHGGDILDVPHDAEVDCDPDAIVDHGYPRRRHAVDTRTNELVAEARMGLDTVRRRKAKAAPVGALRVVALPLGWR